MDDVKNDLLNKSSVRNILCMIGKYAKTNNMRISTHPDQFCLVSSNNPDVIKKSIKMLERHAWVLDQMELDVSPYYAINIHGGTKGNSTVLIDSIKKLSSNVKNRMTLENDERSYNVGELYKVYEETGVPIVLDFHHHTFNDAGLNIEDAFTLAKKTWKVKPLTHLSNTEPELVNGSFTDRRKHSAYVHYIPEELKNAINNDEVDCDFEFKMKNLAIFKAVNEFGLKL